MNLFRSSIAAVLVGLCIVGFFAFRVSPSAFHGGIESDGVYYEAIARSGIGTTPETRMAPWCWRVLTPLATRAFDGKTGFRILGLVSLVFTVPLLGIFFRTMNLSPREQVAGQLLYWGVFWTGQFTLYSPFYIDHHTQLFLIAICLTSFNRAWISTAIFFLVGGFHKESIALFALVPAALFFERRSPPRRALGVFSIFTILGAIGSVLMRTWVEPVNSYSMEAAFKPVLEFQILNPQMWPRIALDIISGVGVLLVFPLLRWRRVATMLAEQPMLASLLGIACIQILLGVDKGRLLLPAVPALTVVTIVLTRDLRIRSMWPWGVLLALHFTIGQILGDLTDHDRYLSRLVPLHSQSPLLESALWLGLPFLVALLVGAVTLRKCRNKPEL